MGVDAENRRTRRTETKKLKWGRERRQKELYKERCVEGENEKIGEQKGEKC